MGLLFSLTYASECPCVALLIFSAYALLECVLLHWDREPYMASVGIISSSSGFPCSIHTLAWLAPSPRRAHVNCASKEWSYIPVGGSLPNTRQKHLAFGAAASMVHPATGYSVVRSLSEAPSYAATIASSLMHGTCSGNLISYQQSAKDAALRAWESLWPQERKRQRAFFLFGLELILQLNIDGTRMFFDTFFRLPEWMWKGFLGASLSSVDLIWFAVIMFITAPNYMRYCLVKHLMSDPSGAKLVQTYLGF